MQKLSPYIKMKVIGALEFADGDTMRERCIAVSQRIFKDEEGKPYQFTWRTIQSWWYHYRQHGATEPKKRVDTLKPRKITPEELLQAIEKVLPYFNQKRLSPTAVYRKCIETGALKSSQIAANTFRRHVKRFDLLKPDGEVSSKRRLAFAKAFTNDMWQCDTLHGPTLNLGGKKQKVFLICFIDDASRVVTHGEFYFSDNTPSLIDCFQKALFKRGVPRAMYVDNGSNYASTELSQACSRIGTVLIHTPVRDGAAKGKIERFFKTVRDQFLIRNLSEIRSLIQLNEAFREWVEETYHKRVHSTLEMKPIDRFGMNLDKVQWLQPSAFNREIFYKEETRSVRADNTFQHHNIRYEPPCHLARTKIQIRFDRHNSTYAPVVYQDDIRLGEATPLNFIDNDRRPNTHTTD